MDVHPPHEPIHTWRDFFVHLITITIGLFIALMLEAGVEWMHHRHLVHVAEANLHQEIQDNQKELQSALAQAPQTDAILTRNITVLRAIRDKQHIAVNSLSFAFVLPTLQTSAWDTARDTGALSYMPYGTVQKYANVYRVQALVQNLDTALIDAASQGIGTVSTDSDPNRMSPAEAQAALNAAASVKARFQILLGVAQQLGKSYSDQLKGDRNP